MFFEPLTPVPRLVKSGLMSSEDVAKAGYKALMKGKTVVIPGFKNKTMALGPRFMPRGMVTSFVRRAQERTGH